MELTRSSSSVVLLNVLENAAKLGKRGDLVLSFIHDFLKSRVELIRSAKVCKISNHSLRSLIDGSRKF